MRKRAAAKSYEELRELAAQVAAEQQARGIGWERRDEVVAGRKAGQSPAAIFAGVEEEGGHEGATDWNDRYLQHLVPYAIDTYAQILTDPGAGERAKLSAAREVLDRRSYTGIKRVAIAGKVTISEETIGRLRAVEQLLGGDDVSTQ